MKHLGQFVLCCLLAVVPATARSGGGHGGGGGFHGGGGFRGVGGGFRGGYGRGVGFGNGFYGRHRYGFALNYWPGYWGYGAGWWDSGLWDYPYYDTGYAYPPYDYSDQQPPVVIYQTGAPTAYGPPPPPVHSEIREYPETPPTATIRPAGEPPIYLIAIKGQDNILAGIAYWVEGDTLQYVNLQHVQKHVPLSTVDRALTTRLNHERNTDIVLPPA